MFNVLVVGHTILEVLLFLRMLLQILSHWHMPQHLLLGSLCHQSQSSLALRLVLVLPPAVVEHDAAAAAVASTAALRVANQQAASLVADVALVGHIALATVRSAVLHLQAEAIIVVIDASYHASNVVDAKKAAGVADGANTC